MLADDDTNDKNADDEGESDDVQSDKDDSSTDDTDQDASAGDIGSGKGGKDDKSGRAGQRITELIEKNKKLEEDRDDLKTRMEALEAMQSHKKSDKDVSDDEHPAVKELKKKGYTPDQIEAAQLLYKSIQGQSESETKKEIERLNAKIAANEEKEALNLAIIDAKEKYGIEVTVAEIAAQRAEWSKSKDPRKNLLAEAPYEDIIALMKSKEIAKAELAKEQEGDDEDAEVTEARKAPKIPAGKDSRQEKKPSVKVTRFDPGNPQGSMDAIERRVLARMGADDDE